jgi:hypothetical protein
MALTSGNLLFKRGSTSEWNTTNPVLSIEEIGIELSGEGVKVKFGDGATTWSDLPYFKGEKGDKGDQGIGLDFSIDGDFLRINREGENSFSQIRINNFSADTLELPENNLLIGGAENRGEAVLTGVKSIFKVSKAEYESMPKGEHTLYFVIDEETGETEIE